MDGHEHTDALTDSSLDREVESILGVEPSPEFLARVRTRVAEEPAPGRWRTSWTFAAATAAAALIIAVIVWPSREQTPSIEAPVPPPQIAETVTPPVTVPKPEAMPRPITRPRIVRAVVPPDRGDLELPDVMLAENEVKAFAALVANIRQRGFDAPLPAAPDPEAPVKVEEMPEPPPLIVDPVEVEPVLKLVTLE